jgi:hypothetical protein
VRRFDWPEDLGPCEIRFIEVPPELHRRYAHAEALALYQMIAKNVGIRRARGRFVLATNIDILFSSELAAFFAEQRLEPGRMYRIDRHDAMSDVPVDAPVEEQLAYCRTHLIRINTREGTFSVSPDGRPLPGPGDVASADSGILFGKGWLPVERYTRQEPFRWAGQRAELVLENVPEPVSALLVDLEPGPGTGGEPLDLEVIGDGHRGFGARDGRSPEPSALAVCAPPARAAVVPRARRRPAQQPGPAGVGLSGLSSGMGAASERTGRQPGQLAAHTPDESGHGGLARAAICHRPAGEGRAPGHLHGPGCAALAAGSQAVHRIQRVRRAGPPRVALPRPAAVLSSHYAPWADIFPKESGLLPGTGWRPLDDYRGETFRLASSGAEVIVSPSAPDSSELGLQLEPSPETARPLDLLLVDSTGQTVARQHLASLKFVRFSVPHAPGRTHVFRLELRHAGAESSAAEPGAVKVFWCGWTGTGRASGPPLSQPWGAGWRWDAATSAMAACGPAELVVTASGQGAGPLFMDLETAAPAQFEIRDIHGGVLAAFTATGRAVHRLDLPLAAGRTHVLELIASAPFARTAAIGRKPRDPTPSGRLRDGDFNSRFSCTPMPAAISH